MSNNPVSLGAKAWWDANTIGQNLSTWTDRINNKVITGVNAPSSTTTISSNTAIVMGNAHERYASDDSYFNFMMSGDCTVLISGSFPNMPSNTNGFVTYFNHVENNGRGIYLRRPSDGNVSAYHFDSNVDSSMARVQNAGALQYIGYIQTPTSISVFSQGQINSSSSFTAVSSSRKWWLGDYPFNSQPAKMDVVDLIIFDYALTQQQLTDLENWLDNSRILPTPIVRVMMGAYYNDGSGLKMEHWLSDDDPDFTASKYTGNVNKNLFTNIHVRQINMV